MLKLAAEHLTVPSAPVQGRSGGEDRNAVPLYDFPNQKVIRHLIKEMPLRTSALRTLGAYGNVFALESFLDEVAMAAGADPVEFRLRYMKDPRARTVIELVAGKADWRVGMKSDGMHGRGFGFARYKNLACYVACVADVTVERKTGRVSVTRVVAAADVRVDDQGRISIPRVDVAVDVGRVIHPERVRAQFEGAAVFGVSLALMGEITAANGRIKQSNFDNYPVARIGEAPYETHVYIVPSEGLPTGVGEPGVPHIAPAICNALFAITGKRIRQLPIKNTRLT